MTRKIEPGYYWYLPKYPRSYHPFDMFGGWEIGYVYASGEIMIMGDGEDADQIDSVKQLGPKVEFPGGLTNES